MSDSGNEPSTEPLELTAESLERIAERELDEIETSLAGIERSIAGFDDGTYGRCEVCGEAIDPGRLAVRASERRCSDHVEVESYT